MEDPHPATGRPLHLPASPCQAEAVKGRARRRLCRPHRFSRRPHNRWAHTLRLPDPRKGNTSSKLRRLRRRFIQGRRPIKASLKERPRHRLDNTTLMLNSKTNIILNKDNITRSKGNTMERPGAACRWLRGWG